jgi:folate-binding protein YgfZ
MNDIATKYRIIAAGAGWAEKAARGRLRFRGSDRKAFLHALLTNEIAALAPGAGTYALYLTPQGRMIADLHVFVRADDVIADVPAEIASSLAATFDGLIFSEDVQVFDESASIRQLSVVGARAADAIAAAVGADAGAVRALPVWSHLNAGGGIVARTDDADEGSWDALVEAAAFGRVKSALEAAGAVAAPDEIMEAMRIDAGRPKFGPDMSAGTLPLEAGLLERAISRTKGCYVGQEVIIRVLDRGGGRIAKHLVRVECGRGAPVPAAGEIVPADGGSATVTSAAWSPRLGRAVALAYVGRATVPQ